MKQTIIQRGSFFPRTLLHRSMSLTLLVTTQVKGRETVVADGQLLRGRVCGG